MNKKELLQQLLKQKTNILCFGNCTPSKEKRFSSQLFQYLCPGVDSQWLHLEDNEAVTIIFSATTHPLMIGKEGLDTICVCVLIVPNPNLRNYSITWYANEMEVSSNFAKLEEIKRLINFSHLILFDFFPYATNLQKILVDKLQKHFPQVTFSVAIVSGLNRYSDSDLDTEEDAIDNGKQMFGNKYCEEIRRCLSTRSFLRLSMGRNCTRIIMNDIINNNIRKLSLITSIIEYVIPGYFEEKKVTNLQNGKNRNLDVEVIVNTIDEYLKKYCAGINLTLYLGDWKSGLIPRLKNSKQNELITTINSFLLDKFIKIK